MSGANYPAYITGSDGDVLDRAFERIVKALNEDAAAFLFGAGMSATSNLPTGTLALKSLLRLFFPGTGRNPPEDNRLEELVSEFPFEVAVQAIQENLGGTRDDLTNQLKAFFLDPAFLPSPAHSDFLSACYWRGRQRLDLVFTTNFDTLLEQVVGSDRAVTITEQNAKEIRNVRADGRLPILHLHGILTEKYQITETDVSGDEFRTLTSEFRTALAYNDAFVFVGYSMNDPDFRGVYLNYRREFIDRKRTEKKTYVVSPAKDRYSYAFGKEVWKARGADWIPMDATGFFAQLKYLLESRFDREAKDNVKRKYAVADEKALEDLIGRVAAALKVGPSEALEFLNETKTRGGGN
ncbi:MAG TPA: SIR2 family protein [Pyrinomonadaceae bacterium]|jgi:hypothetical protein|nr:SIR2 family protein [Pyrinomonadaceae bacterium]